MGNTIGIDYGLKRIGLAIHNPASSLALPIGTIPCQSGLTATVQFLMEHLKERMPIDLFVIGYPSSLKGTNTEMCNRINAFARELQLRTEIPVNLFDERYTSLMAETLLKELNQSRKKRKESIDTTSACVILQNYLDSIGI